MFQVFQVHIEEVTSIGDKGHQNSYYDQTFINQSGLPYSTKMLITYSTCEIFTDWTPLKPSKWKVRFLLPLGTEDNSKFNISFILKISVVFFSTS